MKVTVDYDAPYPVSQTGVEIRLKNGKKIRTCASNAAALAEGRATVQGGRRPRRRLVNSPDGQSDSTRGKVIAASAESAESSSFHWSNPTLADVALGQSEVSAFGHGSGPADPFEASDRIRRESIALGFGSKAGNTPRPIFQSQVNEAVVVETKEPAEKSKRGRRKNTGPNQPEDWKLYMTGMRPLLDAGTYRSVRGALIAVIPSHLSTESSEFINLYKRIRKIDKEYKTALANGSDGTVI